MNVLYFHQYFTTPTYAGGIRSYEMARRLIERGHNVTMVCGGDKLFKEDDAIQRNRISRGIIDGIDVIQINLPYSNSDGVLKRSITFVKFVLFSIKYVFTEKYDVLFSTSTPLTAGIPGIVAKIFRKKPFVFEVRDLWPELPKALGLKNPFLLWGMSVLEKVTYSNADACIGLSPGICDGIRKRSPINRKIALIPNGCDVDIFKPGKRADLVLDGIKPNDFVVAFTGAHGIANGLDAVLNAAKELKKLNRNDIVIVFIGEGKMKKHLIDRVKNEQLVNCRFYDPIPKKQLSDIVSCIDAGLMVLANIPAFYYGTSPNKFFDYISSGIPVINNYPGWLADLIKENNCGVVSMPDNPIDLANSIISLADSKELCKQMGNNARTLALKQFNRKDLSNQFVDFLESIVFQYKCNNK